MELLIPGLLLVALMVWASTRIKRTAAAAFDAETIETDSFIVQKPEGFLNNLNGDPAYAFEAYSREFGEAATDIRAGRVRLIIRDNTSLGEVVKGMRTSDGKFLDDLAEVIGSQHYRVIETKQTEKEAELIVTRKLAEKDSRVFVLEALRLVETSDGFARKLETFVASFELK